MSLLGSLEDLSVPDIVQIVFLSRRTGILEVMDADDRWAIYFSQGLVVGADSPDFPGEFLDWLVSRDLVSADKAEGARDSRVPASELIASGDLAPGLLAGAVRHRIVTIATELRDRKRGEFNFILSNEVLSSELGYEPADLLEGGGIPPNEAMEGAESLKPLQGLEESLRAGKALMKGDAPAEETSRFGFGKEIEEISRESREMPLPAPSQDGPFEEVEPEALEDLESFAEPDSVDAGTDAPFAEPSPEELDSEEPVAEEEHPLAAEKPSPEVTEEEDTAPSRVRIESDQVVEPSDRNVVILETDPLVRVAAKRAFGETAFSLFQYGSVVEARQKVSELLAQSRFFVTFAGLDSPFESNQLLAMIKRRNRHLPVVMVDREVDLQRRHDALKAGANLYLSKPSGAHLSPSLADASLRRFADELVSFVDKSASEWLDLTRSLQPGDREVGEAFYEIAENERVNRSRELIKYLIDELADPDDISGVSDIVLRMAGEYLDRAVLFVAAPTRFIGLGGFGMTGNERRMEELSRRIWIPRDEDSILKTVSETGQTHRGKMRRTPANARIVEGMGELVPSEIIVIPIRYDGVTEGLLMGDNATQQSEIGDTRALEMFLEESGLAFRNAIIANAKRKGIDWED